MLAFRPAGVCLIWQFCIVPAFVFLPESRNRLKWYHQVSSNFSFLHMYCLMVKWVSVTTRFAVSSKLYSLMHWIFLLCNMLGNGVQWWLFISSPSTFWLTQIISHRTFCCLVHCIIKVRSWKFRGFLKEKCNLVKYNA